MVLVTSKFVKFEASMDKLLHFVRTVSYPHNKFIILNLQVSGCNGSNMYVESSAVLQFFFLLLCHMWLDEVKELQNKHLDYIQYRRFLLWYLITVDYTDT